MRIVFLRSNPVEPDSRVEKEVDTLINQGHEVTIVGWDRSQNYREKNDFKSIYGKNVPRTLFGIRSEFGGGLKKNLVPLLKFQIYLFLWLVMNRKKYDCIHACDFDTGLTAFIIKLILKKKLVYDIFDFYVDSFNVPIFLRRIIRKLDYTIINNADATIICSEKRKKQIKGSNPRILEVIHNSPPQYIEKNNIDYSNEKLKIVYVGVLGKGRMIEELCEIVSSNKDFELHIAGFGGLEEKIKRYANVNRNIHFYGKIPYNEALSLESKCDIITAIYDPNIPNHIYASPNKFYESLMLGKPVIMVKDTGMSEIVKKQKLGPVIDFSYQSLENALEELSNLTKDDIKRISNKAQNIYEKDYSWAVMEKRLLKLYERI